MQGTDTENLVQGALYNPFGASSFGSQRIGSNEQQEELKRYIYELEIKPNTRFWALSLQISGDEENNDYELIRYGFRVAQYIQNTTRSFKKNTN